MKKLFIIILFLGSMYLSGFLSAGQVVLLNTTDKPVEFSFKFFHEHAKQKMVISGFTLAPNEKTSFPKPKELHLAQPIKLKVRWKNDMGSSISKTFDQEDVSAHNIRLIKKDGKLSFDPGIS